jgi:sulfate transport system ATP-binding protein
VEREGISKAEARQRKGVDLVEKVGMSILIENVSKRFGTFEALDHINLEIKTNSLVALVGGSGSGKSTLLRIIAGLEKPTEGRIWLAGQDSVSLSIQEREIGFVFQNYALFAHMTVSENIGFGLTLRNIPALESRLVSNNFASDTAGRVCQKLPCSIVWGQRQRVALARALATEPKVLLLDEPFGALDIKVRKELRSWLRTLHGRLSVTTLFVTHDHREAIEVAHEIILFDGGRVKQVSHPKK